MTPRLWIQEALQDAGLMKVGRRVRLHTNQCGDFTLMSRDNWFRLRGHAELPMYSLHVDSLLCYCAYHAGLKEKALASPLRIYHVEHEKGSGWTPEGRDRLDERLRTAGIPSISNKQLDDWAVQMRTAGTPMMFNGPDWGLVTEDLPEYSL